MVNVEEMENLLNHDELSSSFQPVVDASESTTGRALSSGAKSTVRKLPKTIGLIYVWINMGLVYTAQTITLPDMLPRIGANYETIATAIALGSLTCIVLIPFGVFCDRYYNSIQLVMSLTQVLVGVACCVLPWTRTLVVFCLVNTVIILGHTVTNAVGNVIMTRLWQDKASCPLHVMHLGWGIGAFISPLIFRPFLSPDISRDLANVTNETLVIDSTHINTTSTIEIPYGILGGLNLTSAVVFLGFHLSRSRETSNQVNTSRNVRDVLIEFCSPSKWAYGDTLYGTVVLIGMALFYVGMEWTGTPFHLFLFSFAVESKFKFSKQESAVLDSVFNLLYSVGRITFGVLTMFVRLHVLMFIELFGVLIAIICITAFLYTKYHLWAYVCIYAFMLGPVWPAGLAWSNKYILFTSTFSTWLQIVPQLAGIGSKWIVGHLFEDFGPMYAMYFGLGCCIFLFLVMSALQIFVSCYTKRDQSSMQTIVN